MQKQVHFKVKLTTNNLVKILKFKLKQKTAKTEVLTAYAEMDTKIFEQFY